MKRIVLLGALLVASSGNQVNAAFLQEAWQKAQEKAQEIKQKVQSTIQDLKQRTEAQFAAVQQKSEKAFDDLKNKAPKVLAGVPRTILQDKSPYAKTVAMVRHSPDLSIQEKQMLQKRDPLIKQKIKQVLALDVTTAPRIALCCSGGGYRAMLATLGFTKAIRDIGVLDMTSYMVGLSGSTWLFAPWVLRDVDLDAYERLLMPKIAVDLKKTQIRPDAISFKFLQKKLHGQDLSLADVWGALVANVLLGDLNKGGLFSHLSSLAPRVQEGKYPFPICTAVMPPSKFTAVYEWVEFNPFEISCQTFESSIPAWSFGRRFENGQSVGGASEQSLGFWMGVWGSAFALNANDIIRHAVRPAISQENERLDAILNKLVDKAEYEITSKQLGKIRISPAKLHNFLYKVPGSPLEEKESMILVDAGIHMNLPFPPLLRAERNVDIILVCDVSGDISNLMALRTMVDYAREKGLKFPPIDFDKLTKTVFQPDPTDPAKNAFKISVFQDHTNPNVPVVIYMPAITDNEVISKDYPTLKMEYSQDEAGKLIGMAYDRVKKNEQKILKAIKTRIMKKGFSKAAAAA